MVLLSKRRDRRPIEYHIAHEATEESKLELRGRGEIVEGRGTQVAEVWLKKKNRRIVTA